MLFREGEGKVGDSQAEWLCHSLPDRTRGREGLALTLSSVHRAWLKAEPGGNQFQAGAEQQVLCSESSDHLLSPRGAQTRRGRRWAGGLGDKTVRSECPDTA